jgi:DNA repair exonuclease SbcCD ATPase subunit
MAGLDDEVERLYGLPLEEFTPARNELATRLKRDGNADAAAEVKGLAKPSRVAWVLNQLARQEPELVRRLLEAGDELRSVQEHALGGGKGEELRTAISAERAAVDELVRAARSGAGAGLSQDLLDRVRASLSAVAGNDEAREQLERGTATAEFEHVGFPGLAPAASSPTSAPAPRAPRPSRQRPPADRGADELAALRQRREEERQRLRDLRTRVRDLTRDEARARQAARRADSAAERARTEADRAERRRDEAANEAQALAGELERAQAELEEAEASLAASRVRR